MQKPQLSSVSLEMHFYYLERIKESARFDFDLENPYLGVISWRYSGAHFSDCAKLRNY